MRNSNQPPHCHACTVAEVVRDIRITATALCEIFGIERQVAIDKAICLAEKNHGIDLSAIKPLARAIKMEARTIGLDSIGARLGIRAKDVNLLLQNAGLQMKIGKEWRGAQGFPAPRSPTSTTSAAPISRSPYSTSCVSTSSAALMICFRMSLILTDHERRNAAEVIRRTVKDDVRLN